MEKETGRKHIIKKVAGIFLVVLLILTFFSNTIMNYSLPEVAVANATSGAVSNKVRGQGVVETNSDYEITVSGARVIKEVKIEVGDEVKKGDVLFTFEEGENTELNEAQETLEQMELDYAKSLLKMAPDYTSDNNDIKAAKEDLEAAVKVQEKAKTRDKELKDAKAFADSLKKQIDAKQEQIDGIQAQIDGYGEMMSVEAAQTQVDSIRAQLDLLNTQLADLNNSLTSGAGDMDTVELMDSIHNKEMEITTKQEELSQAETTLSRVQETGNSYNQLKTGLETANKELKKLQGDQEAATEKVSELTGQISYEDAKAAVKEKKKSLTAMIFALDKRKEEDALAKQSEDMDLAAAQEKIEKQRELVEKLKKSDDQKDVKAKEAGVVAQVDVKEGDSVSPDTPIATIQLEDSGYVVKVSVTKEQANLVKVGNEATIENVWEEDTSATVKSIKADPENPNQKRIITFEVKGSTIQVGQNLSFAVGEKTSRYEAVVPNNAIREDSKGKFVYVVTVKGTPLGNRYKVKRADVEVMASDDTSSGVTGGVYEYDNVVTNASKPLEEGMQVRLVE